MSKGRQESQTQVSFSHLVISHLIILRPFSFVFFPPDFFSFYLLSFFFMFSVHISRLVIFASCFFFLPLLHFLSLCISSTQRIISRLLISSPFYLFFPSLYILSSHLRISHVAISSHFFSLYEFSNYEKFNLSKIYKIHIFVQIRAYSNNVVSENTFRR